MAEYWTNYDPTVTYPGSKSTTANEYGYVVPDGDAVGDVLLGFKALMVASGFFSSVAGNSSTGSTNRNQYEQFAWTGNSNEQEIMFLLYSSECAGGFSFRQTLGSTSVLSLAAAGRDTGHTPSPTLMSQLTPGTATGSTYFCPHLNDTGDTLDWDTDNLSQDMRIYMWTTYYTLVFLFYYSDYGIYRMNHLFFRLDEPTDGHYTRATGGAVHGAFRTYTYTDTAYLAGVSQGYTATSNVATTIGPFEERQEIADGRFILRQFTVSHTTNLGAYLGTIPNIWVTDTDAGSQYFDTIVIDNQEFVCIQGGGLPEIFVLNGGGGIFDGKILLYAYSESDLDGKVTITSS